MPGAGRACPLANRKQAILSRHARGEQVGVRVMSLRVPQAEGARFDPNQVTGLHLDLEHGCVVVGNRWAADLVDRSAESPRHLSVTDKSAHG